MILLSENNNIILSYNTLSYQAIKRLSGNKKIILSDNNNIILSDNKIILSDNNNIILSNNKIPLSDKNNIIFSDNILVLSNNNNIILSNNFTMNNSLTVVFKSHQTLTLNMQSYQKRCHALTRVFLK